MGGPHGLRLRPFGAPPGADPPAPTLQRRSPECRPPAPAFRLRPPGSGPSAPGYRPPIFWRTNSFRLGSQGALRPPAARPQPFVLRRPPSRPGLPAAGIHPPILWRTTSCRPDRWGRPPTYGFGPAPADLLRHCLPPSRLMGGPLTSGPGLPEPATWFRPAGAGHRVPASRLLPFGFSPPAPAFPSRPAGSGQPPAEFMKNYLLPARPSATL